MSDPEKSGKVFKMAAVIVLILAVAAMAFVLWGTSLHKTGGTSSSQLGTSQTQAHGTHQTQTQGTSHTGHSQPSHTPSATQETDAQDGSAISSDGSGEQSDSPTEPTQTVGMQEDQPSDSHDEPTAESGQTSPESPDSEFDPVDYDSPEEYADDAETWFEEHGYENPWDDAYEYWELNAGW